MTVADYFIPKGSMVMANIRFLHFDDKYWDNPDEFKPERWLLPGEDSSNVCIAQHVNFIPFSLGKRRCLGENLAKSEYLLFGILLLKNFNFRVARDEGGEGQPPSLVGEGMIHAAPPFRMIMNQRRQ